MDNPATICESGEGPPKRPQKNDVAGEVKRKTRRLQREAPPDNLLQHLQQSLRPPKPAVINPNSTQLQDDQEAADADRDQHHINHQTSAAAPLAITVLSSSTFESTLNEQQHEERLINFHLDLVTHQLGHC